MVFLANTTLFSDNLTLRLNVLQKKSTFFKMKLVFVVSLMFCYVAAGESLKLHAG